MTTALSRSCEVIQIMQIMIPRNREIKTNFTTRTPIIRGPQSSRLRTPESHRIDFRRRLRSVTSSRRKPPAVRTSSLIHDLHVRFPYFFIVHTITSSSPLLRPNPSIPRVRFRGKPAQLRPGRERGGGCPLKQKWAAFHL